LAEPKEESSLDSTSTADSNPHTTELLVLISSSNPSFISKSSAICGLRLTLKGLSREREELIIEVLVP
jgi:hypothetical protein